MRRDGQLDGGEERRERSPVNLSDELLVEYDGFLCVAVQGSLAALPRVLENEELRRRAIASHKCSDKHKEAEDIRDDANDIIT